MEFISKTSRAVEPHKIIEELTEGNSGSYDLGFLFVSSFIDVCTVKGTIFKRTNVEILGFNSSINNTKTNNKVSTEEIVMMLQKRITLRSLIQQYLGPVPAAGFFCAGEIGPVCKTNFLHGFTNSIALFYPKR